MFYRSSKMAARFRLFMGQTCVWCDGRWIGYIWWGRGKRFQFEIEWEGDHFSQGKRSVLRCLTIYLAEYTYGDSVYIHLYCVIQVDSLKSVCFKQQFANKWVFDINGGVVKWPMQKWKRYFNFFMTTWMKMEKLYGRFYWSRL